MVKTPVKLTFEEYLSYDDGTENRYELVAGELVKMPPASDSHEAIITLLLLSFYLEIQRTGADLVVRPNGTGVRTTINQSRLPDIVVFTSLQRQSVKGKSAVLLSPPLLVVEVVSPGEKNAERDYEKKKAEYEEIGIPEYWIVDPVENKVTVMLLVEHYQETVFTGEQRIVSQIFPELNLKASQILSA